MTEPKTTKKLSEYTELFKAVMGMSPAAATKAATKVIEEVADADDSGSIDVADLKIVLEAAKNKKLLKLLKSRVAHVLDADGNGKIDINDALYAYREGKALWGVIGILIAILYALFQFCMDQGDLPLFWSICAIFVSPFIVYAGKEWYDMIIKKQNLTLTKAVAQLKEDLIKRDEHIAQLEASLAVVTQKMEDRH